MKLSKVSAAIIIAVSIIIFAGIGTSIYFYSKYQSAQKELSDPNTKQITEAKAMALKVGKLIDIPVNEVPSIATIQDIERLRDQQFFSKGKNGDILLIFSQAKKAILYDPVANKIIEVGPVTLPTPTGTVAGAEDASSILPTSATKLSPTSASKFIYVVIYNGTTTPTLTDSIQNLIKEKTQNIQITQTTQASRDSYEKTLVVDLKGNKKDSAVTLAQLVSGEVSDLPAGESKPPNADFLVIIGTPQSTLTPTP